MPLATSGPNASIMTSSSSTIDLDFSNDPFFQYDPFASLTSFDSSFNSSDDVATSMTSTSGTSSSSTSQSQSLYHSPSTMLQQNPIYSSIQLPPTTNFGTMPHSMSNTLGGRLPVSQYAYYKQSAAPGPHLSEINPAPHNKPHSLNTSYTGFSVQGGRIPNIPCDTGVGVGFNARADPLSPPIETAPQPQLPPPLVPTCSISTNESTPIGGEKRTDADKKEEKDIVDTFDNLI